MTNRMECRLIAVDEHLSHRSALMLSNTQTTTAEVVVEKEKGWTGIKILSKRSEETILITIGCWPYGSKAMEAEVVVGGIFVLS